MSIGRLAGKVLTGTYKVSKRTAKGLGRQGRALRDEVRKSEMGADMKRAMDAMKRGVSKLMEDEDESKQ
jgi:hypothetical protein